MRRPSLETAPSTAVATADAASRHKGENIRPAAAAISICIARFPCVKPERGVARAEDRCFRKPPLYPAVDLYFNNIMRRLEGCQGLFDVLGRLTAAGHTDPGKKTVRKRTSEPG